jgi:hypothetical protein
LKYAQEREEEVYLVKRVEKELMEAIWLEDVDEARRMKNQIWKITIQTIYQSTKNGKEFIL